MDPVAPEKIMLVDGSAFIFDLCHEADARRNGNLIEFLDDARHEFMIVIVTDDDPDRFEALLNETDLSEALSPSHKRDQFFLRGKTRSWSEWEDADVAVIIQADPSCPYRLGNYTFSLHPDDLKRQDAFGRFSENYDHNVLFGQAGGFETSGGGMADMRLDEALKECRDTNIVWCRAIAAFEVVSLTRAFDKARSVTQDLPPQDGLLQRLRTYFEMAVAGDGIEGMDKEWELSALRTQISGLFARYNVDGSYDPDALHHIPPTSGHQKLLDEALAAIRRIINGETPLPS